MSIQVRQRKRQPSFAPDRIYSRQQANRLGAFTDAPGQNSLDGRGSDKARLDYDNNRDKSLSNLCVGTVTAYSPYDGTYRVQLSGKTTEVTCIDSFGRGLPLSVGRAAAHPPNSRVVVFFQGGLNTNIILGSIPDVGATSRFFSQNRLYSHLNHLQGRIGARKDEYQITYAHASPSRYFNDARATDLTSLGDLTYSNFMGGLIHMSMWQLVLRSSNGCGIWMNFIDELMRQVAKNLQVWTPAGQINKYATCGETFNYEGQALYDWEGLGMLIRPTGKNGDDWIDRQPDRAIDPSTMETTAELLERDMTPFFRFEQYSGWFGQGGMRGVKSLPSGNFFKADDPVETSQVYRESVNVSGALLIQAAGGIALERTIKIPCYQNKYEPFDDKGDRDNNDYTYLGDPSDKVSTLDVEKPEHPLTESVTQAINSDDFYDREEYKSLYAFAKHSSENGGRDYERVNPGIGIEPLDGLVGQLTEKQFMPNLKTVKIAAETQPGKRADYVTRTSGFYATQDGGWLLRDGWGNEIRTGVNGIEFMSVSDITLLGHRRIVSMSGDDTIITANKSLDLTSAQNDIRLQAFNNMEMVAAISGAGRTLIENRGNKEFDAWVAEEDKGEDIANNGIFMVAKDSTLTTYAKSLFTKCSGDAFHDFKNCWNYAQDVFEIKANGCAEMLVGPKESATSHAGLLLTQDKAISLSRLFIKESCTIEKQLLVQGAVQLAGSLAGDGSIAVSGQVAAGRGCVVEPVTSIGEETDGIKGQGLAAKDNVERMVASVADITYLSADRLFEPAHEKYQPEQIGHDLTVKSTHFKNRTAKQYGTEEYVFMMPAFVTEISVGNTFGLNKYYDKVDDEGPFPGKTRWNEPCCVTRTGAFTDKDPYVVDNQNDVEKYSQPEIKVPAEIFSSIVIT